ncbi:MAG: G5 domain-containing protein [Actinomycetaceae bacterium]|nr:G5 domain-containing protein [Actinomycetaceae bacterium]
MLSRSTQVQHARSRRRIVYAASAASAFVIGLASLNIAQAHTTVLLEVDGLTRPVSTWDNSVSGVLRAADIEVGEYDSVTPAPAARLADWSTVTVRHAHQVSISTDNGTRTVWTTAESLDEILGSIRFDATIPAQRSGPREELHPIAVAGTTVHVRADGKSVPVVLERTFDVTRVLERAGVEVSPIDRVHVQHDAAGALEIVVQRVSRGTVTTTEEVDYEVVEEETDELAQGKRSVETEGVKGERTIVRYQQSVDGTLLVDTEISNSVTTDPVDEVVLVGTADPEELAARLRSQGKYVDAVGDPLPSTAYSGADPRGIAQQMVADRGWGDDQFSCLLTLWERESHWNPHAHNASSGAYGIPQSLPGSKMASAGADWRTNPETQIRWGLGYISNRYGTPCGALGHSNSVGWY